MLKFIFETFIPNKIKQRLGAYYNKKRSINREQRESELPKVPLEDKHIENCEVLLNRFTMLTKLEKGGKVAEIGVDRGEFSDLILKITEPEILHLIDVWHSKRYHSGLFEHVKNKFDNLIKSGRVQLHRNLSTEAVEYFPDGYFNWIYIDTNHSYETTRDELLKYAPKVKPDGIIAGHDYSIGYWITSKRYGVIEAVHEFCVKQDWELIYLTIDPIEMQSFAIKRILQ